MSGQHHAGASDATSADRTIERGVWVRDRTTPFRLRPSVRADRPLYPPLGRWSAHPVTTTLNRGVRAAPRAVAPTIRRRTMRRWQQSSLRQRSSEGSAVPPLHSRWADRTTPHTPIGHTQLPSRPIRPGTPAAGTGGDLQACRPQRRRHLGDPERQGARDVLHPAGLGEGADRRLGLRHRPHGRHRHERPRRSGRNRREGRLLRRSDVPSQGRRHGPIHGPRGDSRRGAGVGSASARLRRLRARRGRRCRVCHRQPVRPRPHDDCRHRQRHWA